jgi:hypothetical protein
MSPVWVSETRREYIPVGSTPASMRVMVSDTHTGLTPASSLVHLTFKKRYKKQLKSLVLLFQINSLRCHISKSLGINFPTRKVTET